VVLTEHSLIGLKSIVEIHYNAVFRMLLPSCDGVIAVSRATRNNIMMRGQLDVGRVRVVPNGVAKPCRAGKDRKKNSDGLIKIIVVGRLTFRRGTDLLI
jgi:glycosyltransferase involved in cell wall biosynthesis